MQKQAWNMVTANQWPLNEPLDMPMQTYLDLQAISCSSLKAISRSPAHLAVRYNNLVGEHVSFSSRSTPDTIFGEALHTLVLEPDDFAENWIAGPDGPWTRKAAKDEIARLLDLGYPKSHILKPAVYERVYAAGQSVTHHPYAGKLLGAEGHTEKVFLW